MMNAYVQRDADESVVASPWADNPFSALAIYPLALHRTTAAAPAARARLPWWLNPPACAALALILMYRVLIPAAWKRRCIYTPTCSCYGLRSIQKYGLLRGSLRTWHRVGRCNGTRFLGGSDEP
jgi:putative membrane protein insertion efficiency factor